MSGGRPDKPDVVPLRYCDGGVCSKIADRWEWAAVYGEWIAVCDDHAARIQAHNERRTA